MPAPKGNKFWEARSSHGRNPKFESPEQMWAMCVEYFEWVEENPMEEEKLFHAQGIITRGTIYKPRPMTISGLCLFLDIGEQTWRDYTAKEDFSGITKKVEQIIYNQKFAGAVADQMNPNIIARELGLKDHSESTNKHLVTIETMSDEELESIAAGRS